MSDEIALGPGKVALLESLRKTGSIKVAARQLEMSYMRAWTLIRSMNRCFKEPLVVAVRGGSKGGGAKLTEAGHKALGLYHHLSAQCFDAMQPDWKQHQRLLNR